VPPALLRRPSRDKSVNIETRIQNVAGYARPSWDTTSSARRFLIGSHEDAGSSVAGHAGAKEACRWNLAKRRCFSGSIPARKA